MEVLKASFISQVSMDAASRYGELLRKVHTVDALADSNRLLRQEKEVLQGKADEALAKADKLQAEVEPLRVKVAEATAEIETIQVGDCTREAFCANIFLIK